MISEIIEKIKNFIKKLTKKDLYLNSASIVESSEEDSIEQKDLSTENLSKNTFIENTYEINLWQEKIENGTEKVESLPLELKLKIIEEYKKQITQLEQEISMKKKKIEITNN